MQAFLYHSNPHNVGLNDKNDLNYIKIGNESLNLLVVSGNGIKAIGEVLWHKGDEVLLHKGVAKTSLGPKVKKTKTKINKITFNETELWLYNKIVYETPSIKWCDQRVI